MLLMYQALRLIIIGLILVFVASTNGYSQSASKSLSIGSQPRVSHMRLTVDKSLTLQISKPVSEALVANPDIADVVPLTANSIYLLGKKVGLTRLTLLDDRKELMGVVEVEVSYDIAALRAELRRNIPGAEFRLRTAHGRILLAGVAPDSVALSRASEIANQFARGGFLNTMTVRAPQQVMVEVRFVEVSRTAGRDLGVTTNVAGKRYRHITGGTPETGTDLLSAAAVVGSLVSGGAPFGTFLSRTLAHGVQADVVIQALEERGLGRRLAEPNLVTLSGTSANFLAGGEVPYEVQAGDNKTAIQFKRYGIELSFTPTVLEKRKISLDILPSVSDLDFANAVKGQPALTTRSAKTTVELRDGQSFAIAGLLQRRHNKNVNQLPYIGRLPVLGALFRSAAYQKDESDLVIIVTPRLVRPARPGQKLATPLDLKKPTNDREYFLRGDLDKHKWGYRRYGHVLDVSGWEATVGKGGAAHESYK